MIPKYPKHLVTAPLTEEDANILHGHVYDGNGKPLTKAQIVQDAMTRRIIAHRDVDTGEMVTTVHAKTHDNKPLPYYLVTVENLHD